MSKYRYFKIISLYRLDEVHEKIDYLNGNKWLCIPWENNGKAFLNQEFGVEISIKNLINLYPEQAHLFKNIEDRRESKTANWQTA